MATAFARMFAGTSDITRHTPKVMNKVTCDTIVEITETPAYLNSFRLDGWAMIWRTRATIGWSDDQMCFSGGCSGGFVRTLAGFRPAPQPYPGGQFRPWQPVKRPL